MYMDSPGISSLAERNILYSRLREKAAPQEDTSIPVPGAMQEQPPLEDPRETPGESPGPDMVERVISNVVEKGRLLVTAGKAASGYAQALGQKEMAEKITTATKTLEKGTDALKASAGCWTSGKVLVNPGTSPEEKKKGVGGFVKRAKLPIFSIPYPFEAAVKYNVEFPILQASA